ncbi:hypothetical protein BRM3_00200 [Brachybacterium huguangmaarense]|uniref:Uncharacterized protein n=1 Tax=Brachybacterium huguangmaarense TaxID=1652028 RepID=A0ABY6G268_9MICO|nr:hypothetical protein BRM3_00200 [Brachybacterium huguangmaarense]
MSVTKGLLVRFDALPGKEDDVKDFLDSGRALVEEEPATTACSRSASGPPPSGSSTFPPMTPDVTLTCLALLR